MSLLKANSVQIGQSATATQNFTLSVPSSPDGTIKLARGNSGATTADVLSVDASGNVTTTLANGSISASKLSGAQTGSAPIYGVRAWCVFNGTIAGTNAPTAGGNVTNVTRNGVGDYTVNFTTAMPTSNYSVSITARSTATLPNSNAPNAGISSAASAQQSGSIRIDVLSADGANFIDSGIVTIIVVG